MEQKEKSKKQIEEEKDLEEQYIKKLEVLSFKIKKQPDLYLKEIAKYKQDFLTIFQVIKDQPLLKNKKFTIITIFLSQIAHHFKTDLGFLPEYIQEFLNHYNKQMNPYMRHKLVQALIILRSKNVIQPIKSAQFLMQLYNCQSKELRKMITSHLINDLKRMNKHHRNQKINKQLQVYIHEILKTNKDKIAKISLQLMIMLYKRNIWNDDKTVNIIAAGCFNEYYKVKLVSCYFLVETTEPTEELSESEEEDVKDQIMRDKKKKQFSKKTKASERKYDANHKKILNRKAKKLKRKLALSKTFFPIDRIFNPQDFCEKLFGILRKSQDKFPVKLVMMHVLSRMIGRHKLIIISFYSFIQKYINPHQKEIHKILSYLAESVHDLIPQEDLEPIIKHLIDNFVNDRCTEQSITIGINTIREMSSRNKFILDDFNLGYLADYYSFKNKNVAKAAKALINLFREINPLLLSKKFRGKLINQNEDALQVENQYLNDKVQDTILGAELLEQQGQIPIYYDKIMTDEDFKKIRFLQQKKKDLEDQQKLEEEEQQSSEEIDVEDNDDEDEEEEENLQNEVDGEQKQKIKKQQDNDDDEIEDSSDEDEEEYSISGDEGGDEDDEDIEFVSGSDEEEDDDEGEEEDEQHENGKSKKVSSKIQDEEVKEQIQNGKDNKDSSSAAKNDEINKKSEKLKQKNKNRKIELNLDGYSSFEEDEEDDPNPHGFIDSDKLLHFKKSKAEKRKEQRENTLTKEKKNYGPKPKGGGTTNEQKLKQKPLSMVRPKKNTEFLNKLSTKSKIKELKNQLGHVRSGKQAKRLKQRKLR